MTVGTAAGHTLEAIAAELGDTPRAVPALLAERSRAGREFRRPRRGGRLRGDRGDRRQRLPGMEAARPPERLPAGDRGDRPGQLLRRPGVPRGARAAARGGPGAGDRAVHRRLRQSEPHLGRPRVAAARTSVPILLKGILHPDDAREARERGVDGVVVSNHGGRQVDGAIAAFDALPPIAAAVGEDLTILFDSGIRSGADVFKALALGADAVLLGRPYLWGMALEGADGVEKVLRWILAELDLTMGLSGFTSPGSSGPRSCGASRWSRRARPRRRWRPRRRASRCDRASPRSRPPSRRGRPAPCRRWS